MDERRDRSWEPGASQSGDALIERVPARFRVSMGVIDLGAARLEGRYTSRGMTPLA